MISLEKLKILASLQKLHKNVGDLGKIFVKKALKNCLKSNKSPNLVTLLMHFMIGWSKMLYEWARWLNYLLGDLPTLCGGSNLMWLHVVDGQLSCVDPTYQINQNRVMYNFVSNEMTEQLSPTQVIF